MEFSFQIIYLKMDYGLNTEVTSIQKKINKTSNYSMFKE